MKMNMSKIEEIAREYANEYFTNEMLLSGDETWDYAAQAWLDEHYPDLSDKDRHSISSRLDRLYSRRRYRATLQKVKAMEAKCKQNRKETETSVFEGMTKSELLAKIRELCKKMDFIEAERLHKVYKSLK